MGFALNGYLLEKPRVGSANSPFTASPDNLVSNSGAFSTAYPTGVETNPRADYLVFAHGDGNLPVATFDWTKNEGIVVGGAQVPFARFDYQGREQRFKPLPGAAPEVAKAVLGPSSNTTRIVAPKPTITNLSAFPMRISVGSTGSGVTFNITLVPSDGGFTIPSAGTVQLSLSTGNLNWSPSDLSTYNGQIVRFQRQSFYAFADSNGRLGVPPDVLLLNPIPATGQLPIVRFGYDLSLIPIEVPNEASFTTPSAGTFQWALNTGRLNLSPSDVAANPGKAVYYDGVLFGRALGLPSYSLGTMPSGYSSLAIGVLPSDGADLVFRVGSQQFSQFEIVTGFTDSTGKAGVVQVLRTGPTTGQARFSLADRTRFVGQAVQLTVGDLAIDHGISIRLFRNPVNLNGADPTLKDVASFYQIDGATLASPIIASPQVFLPAIPLDSSSYPITVRVEQGTGTFTGTLPRLDVASPSPGVGYVLDLDQRILQYAQRKNQTLIPISQASGAMVLPDPLVLASNVVLELETGTGTGVYTTLTPGVDALFDSTSGEVTFTTTQGSVIRTSTQGSSTGTTTFTDGTAGFSSVLSSDILVVTSGPAAGLYVVQSVPTSTSLVVDVAIPSVSGAPYQILRGREILADRFFQPLVLADPHTFVERGRFLATASNSPRVSIDTTLAAKVRFRFGTTRISTSVTTVATDGSFTAPSSLPTGHVEISLSTGHLNFSSVDLSLDVYLLVRLSLLADYRLTPQLGFIDYTERALTLDEGYVTYLPVSAVTATTTAVDPPTVTEPVTWLVRKEVVQAHPTPTSVLHFNPTGKRIAASPPPAVFRGGRPQELGVQCVVDTAASTITFLPDTTPMTDALPHGALIDPTERVYIDYYVTQAFGGEKTTTVQQPPMAVAQLGITTGNTTFVLSGDWTSTFLANLLLRIEHDQVYLIDHSTYDPSTGTTTVTLYAGQSFRDDFVNPNVFLASGPTPIVTVAAQPSYFIAEGGSWGPFARGSFALPLPGDVTGAYPAGTVVFFSTGPSREFYQVTGSSYSSTTNQTTLSISEPLLQQYTAGLGGSTLYRSVRPVFEASTTSSTTNLVPILTQPYTVYRRTMGQPGLTLSSPSGFTIDESGRLNFSTPLLPNEEFGILYTGHRIVPAGPRLRASYTSIIVPTISNGLLGQILKTDYTLLSPDSFYYRVETFTNFKAELAQEYEDDAKSSAPSGGPNTSNAAQTTLAQQGRPSVFFNEGHLANEDVVARSALVFYNDAVNFLEDTLQNVDGRVVGHRSGRFHFDGLLGNPIPTSLQASTNQIDDVFKVSDAPYVYSFSFPSFSIISVGTYQAIYQASSISRFYRTFRRSFGVTAPGVNTGDPILDTGAKNLTSVDNVRTRPAFALVTKPASSGDTALTVDNARGSATLVRPPFLTGMKCVVQKPDGTFLVDDVTPITLSSVSTTLVTFTPGLPTNVPAGSTIYRAPSDDSNASGGVQPGVNENVHYQAGSYGIDPTQGQITYVKAEPPLDGSLSPVPVPNQLVTKQIPAGQAISADVFYSNTSVTPTRAPVFDGGTTDDDGEMLLPLVGPTLDAELSAVGGYLSSEISVIQTTTGTIRTATQAPFVGTGSLNPARTVITLTSGTFPSPVPAVHDLVRITTGLNGATTFRRVTAVTTNSVTVDEPFTTVDSGFTFVVGVSTTLVAGTATVASTTLTDGSANFVTAGVKAGHTVVITSGGSIGERRQVVAVLAPTQLQLAATVGSGTYRVTNSLTSFGGAPSSILDGTLVPDLAGEVALLTTNVPPTKPNNERQSIESFFELVFTDIVTPSTGSASGTTLTDPSATFLSSGVSATDLVYIRNGTAAGFYQVVSVPSETTLTVAQAFSAPDVAASYRVGSVFDTNYQTLVDLFAVLSQIDTFITQTQAFQSIITTPVTVVKVGNIPDPNAFARATLTSDLDSRYAQTLVRQSYLTDPAVGPVAKVTNILSGSERLYDKRWVWVDARINLSTGILVKKTRAIDDRVKAQEDVVNQLMKLLAVTT